MQISGRNYMSSQPSLVLSFLPVEFEGSSSLSVGNLTFESAEHLRSLRENYQHTHIFHRSGSNILCIPLTDSAEQIGKSTIISIEDHRIAERLIREALFSHFRTQMYEIVRFKPFTLVDKSRNLLSECLSQEQLQQTRGLAIYPKYEIHSRTVFPRSQEPLPGIAIDVYTAYQIELTASELISMGLDGSRRQGEICG